MNYWWMTLVTGEALICQVRRRRRQRQVTCHAAHSAALQTVIYRGGSLWSRMMPPYFSLIPDDFFTCCVWTRVKQGDCNTDWDSLHLGRWLVFMPWSEQFDRVCPPHPPTWAALLQCGSTESNSELHVSRHTVQRLIDPCRYLLLTPLCKRCAHCYLIPFVIVWLFW